MRDNDMRETLKVLNTKLLLEILVMANLIN
jgi:hypothetical protein